MTASTQEVDAETSREVLHILLETKGEMEAAATRIQGLITHVEMLEQWTGKLQ